ncbi:MAG: TRAP transporter TatT component family protein [Pseudomonadales bacterium]|nr:TRAP transporter TatT component family protein [Pseudomonadales bacterium]
MRKFLNLTAMLFLTGLLSSCANLMSSVTSGLAEDLADTILNSNDVETVREGIPAYLLMIDSFLRSSPDNPELLMAASNLNSAFTIFTNEARGRLLSQKSFDYSLRAACVTNKTLCDLDTAEFEDYQRRVDAITPKDVDIAYSLAVAWTGWMQAHSSDWNAIAQLGKVKYLMARCIELDESISDGGPHLYMGGLETVLPASLGGNPEKGREHFERSIEISQSQFLMAKVVFAEQYAKLVFDKELHDRLLNEVLAADPVSEGRTLTNTVAQTRARELLAESDDYF